MTGMKDSGHDAFLSANLLRIVQLWKRYGELDNEMCRFNQHDMWKLCWHRWVLSDILHGGTRGLTRDVTPFLSKYSDEESVLLIRAAGDPFPLEALARLVITKMSLTPSSLRSLIKLNQLLRRATIGRIAPLPKIVLGVVIAAILFLIKEIPQSVIEVTGLRYDLYQSIVTLVGLIVLVYLGVLGILFWRMFWRLDWEFKAVDRVLRVAALVSRAMGEREMGKRGETGQPSINEGGST